MGPSGALEAGEEASSRLMSLINQVVRKCRKDAPTPLVPTDLSEMHMGRPCARNVHPACQFLIEYESFQRREEKNVRSWIGKLPLHPGKISDRWEVSIVRHGVTTTNLRSRSVLVTVTNRYH